MTNGDKIRQMSDEELVEFLFGRFACLDCPAVNTCGGNSGMCKFNMFKWLIDDVEEE